MEGRVIWGLWSVISGWPLICLWLRIVMRSTWTGIGTTSRGRCTSTAAVWLSTTPALTRFHLARRFWNQILTWTSLRRSWRAISERSVSDRYFLPANSRSSSISWSLLNAVRRRRRRRWRSLWPPPSVALPAYVAGRPSSMSSSEYEVSASANCESSSTSSLTGELYELTTAFCWRPTTLRWLPGTAIPRHTQTSVTINQSIN